MRQVWQKGCSTGDLAASLTSAMGGKRTLGRTSEPCEATVAGDQERDEERQSELPENGREYLWTLVDHVEDRANHQRDQKRAFDGSFVLKVTI